MSKIEDGGPAFPVLPPVDQNGRECPGFPFPDQGMSLRDYFAGQALAGYFAGTPLHRLSREDMDDAAGYLYTMADAMLVARAKPPPP